MKTLLDRSTRDGMLLSHKLMLIALVAFTLSLFLQYGSGQNWQTSADGTLSVLVGGGDFVRYGSGWDLAPHALPLLLVLFVIYLGDPDDNIPFFKWVGWWLTPVALLTMAQGDLYSIGNVIGWWIILATLLIAGLHTFELVRAKRKAASAPPAASQG
jgi:hypothetical protein